MHTSSRSSKTKKSIKYPRKKYNRLVKSKGKIKLSVGQLLEKLLKSKIRLLIYSLIILSTLTAFSLGILFMKGMLVRNELIDNGHNYENFTQVKNIKIGDRLYIAKEATLAGNIIKSIEKMFNQATVYNLSVDNTNTYFAENIAVHNKTYSCPWSYINPYSVTNLNDMDRYDFKVDVKCDSNCGCSVFKVGPDETIIYENSFDGYCGRTSNNDNDGKGCQSNNNAWIYGGASDKASNPNHKIAFTAKEMICELNLEGKYQNVGYWSDECAHQCPAPWGELSSTEVAPNAEIKFYIKTSLSQDTLQGVIGSIRRLHDTTYGEDNLIVFHETAGGTINHVGDYLHDCTANFSDNSTSTPSPLIITCKAPPNPGIHTAVFSTKKNCDVPFTYTVKNPCLIEDPVENINISSCPENKTTISWNSVPNASRYVVEVRKRGDSNLTNCHLDGIDTYCCYPADRASGIATGFCQTNDLVDTSKIIAYDNHGVISNSVTLNLSPGDYDWAVSAVNDMADGSKCFSTKQIGLNIVPVCNYFCTGTEPTDPNASLCTGSKTGLSADTPWSINTDCTGIKCEYECKTGFYWDGTACVISQCGLTMPSNSVAYANDGNPPIPIGTNWTYSATNTATKCEFSCNLGYYWNGTACLAYVCTNDNYSAKLNVKKCSETQKDDETGLAANTNYSINTDCTANKCEYECIDGYAWSSTDNMCKEALTCPTANFSVSPTSGNTLTNFVFTNTSTGSPTSYLWDFEYDGSTFSGDSSEINPTNKYTTTSTKTIRLAAIKSGCTTSYKDGSVFINSAPPNISGYVFYDADGDGTFDCDWSTTAECTWPEAYAGDSWKWTLSGGGSARTSYNGYYQYFVSKSDNYTVSLSDYTGSLKGSAYRITRPNGIFITSPSAGILASQLATANPNGRADFGVVAIDSAYCSQELCEIQTKYEYRQGENGYAGNTAFYTPIRPIGNTVPPTFGVTIHTAHQNSYPGYQGTFDFNLDTIRNSNANKIGFAQLNLTVVSWGNILTPVSVSNSLYGSISKITDWATNSYTLTTILDNWIKDASGENGITLKTNVPDTSTSTGYSFASPLYARNWPLATAQEHKPKLTVFACSPNTCAGTIPTGAEAWSGNENVDVKCGPNVEWTLNHLANTANKCEYKYVCPSVTVPLYAHKCSDLGDDQDEENITETDYVSSWSFNDSDVNCSGYKCEIRCDSGYSWNSISAKCEIKPVEPWWQIGSGNVFSNNNDTFITNAIENIVPSGKTMFGDLGGSATWNLGEINYSEVGGGLGSEAVAVTSGEYLGTTQNYNFWVSKLADYTNTDYQTETSINLDTNTIDVPTGIYHVNNSLIVNSDNNISNQVAILVNGDITITSNLRANSGAILILISSGNISIDPSVGQIDAFLIADQTINTGNDNFSPKQLIINGGLIGWSGVNLQRTYSALNAPAELFNQNTNMINALKNTTTDLKAFRTYNYTWQEVAP